MQILVKLGKNKRGQDIWNEEAVDLTQKQRINQEEYFEGIARQEGVSADYEKFIHGLNTGSHKIPLRDQK